LGNKGQTAYRQDFSFAWRPARGSPASRRHCPEGSAGCSFGG